MSGTTLKLIALVLMFLDHIYEFIQGMPIWLTWLGRISAPLFIFCMAWGLHYTRSRKKYLRNMYCWSIGMALGDALICVLLPGGVAPYNNIFTTLFLIGIIVTIMEGFQNGGRPLAVRLLLYLIGAQILSLALVPLSLALLPKGSNAYLLVSSIFPSLVFCEGGPVIVAFGVALYFAKQKTIPLVLVIISFSFIWLLFAESHFSYESLFLKNYQWMMIGALPLILSYNGQKGSGLKWMFYIFYPAHIFLLYGIGSFLNWK